VLPLPYPLHLSTARPHPSLADSAASSLSSEGFHASVGPFKDSIRVLDVGVLLSNAGLSYPYARSGLWRRRLLASMGARGGPL
jgi:hypothetical protein